MEKRGTAEELEKDLQESGKLHITEEESKKIPLETIMSATRIKIDDAMQQILRESGLPLFLFDYLISSVQNDIRKADLDTRASQNKEG